MAHIHFHIVCDWKPFLCSSSNKTTVIQIFLMLRICQDILPATDCERAMTCIRIETQDTTSYSSMWYCVLWNSRFSHSCFPTLFFSRETKQDHRYMTCVKRRPCLCVPHIPFAWRIKFEMSWKEDILVLLLKQFTRSPRARWHFQYHRFIFPSFRIVPCLRARPFFKNLLPWIGASFENFYANLILLSN